MWDPALQSYTQMAVQRQRTRDLSAEIRAQERYLESHLGRDRAGIQNMGETLLVTISSQGAFEGSSDRMTPAGRDQVARIAAALLEYPHSRIAVGGHVMPTGNAYLDGVLSARRAVAVKAQLSARGVDPCRIGVIGQGAADPLAPSLTERQARVNDRIEIFIQPLQDGACIG